MAHQESESEHRERLGDRIDQRADVLTLVIG